MVSVRTHISKSLVYNLRGDCEEVPEEIIVLSCRLAGYSADEVRRELDALVAEGELTEEDGYYARVEDD
jgi:hypothetical protein